MPPKKSPQKIKFEQKQLEVFKRLHPDTPYAESFIKKFSDKDANSLTAMVVEWLKLNGHQAERINTMGVARIERGITDEVFNRGTPQKITWTPSTSTKGSADISATIKGFSVKLEVKFGKDRMSEHQKKYEQDVKAAGGIYYIVKDFDSFFDWYAILIDKLSKFTLDL